MFIVKEMKKNNEENIQLKVVGVKDKQEKEKIQGVTSTELKLEGFRDINIGEITAFYPILK
jgi:hypothetical protein